MIDWLTYGTVKSMSPIFYLLNKTTRGFRDERMISTPQCLHHYTTLHYTIQSSFNYRFIFAERFNFLDPSALWLPARIWLCTMGHCVTNFLCTTGHCCKFGYVIWAAAQNTAVQSALSVIAQEDLVMHYGPQRRIWLCTVGHSKDFVMLCDP